MTGRKARGSVEGSVLLSLTGVTPSVFPYGGSPFSFSIVILYLRFGAQVLQDNFVAELSAHYQNYILVLRKGAFRLPCVHG